MQERQSIADSGPLAGLSAEEKKKRLDAMVKIWQSDSERKIEREGQPAFVKALGLDEYRYSVSLRFPEWERTAVVGQVVMQRATAGNQSDTKDVPVLFSVWRRDGLLKMLPNWKLHLPNENVFNITVRLTPGGLGEGSKWAVVMPKELIPRYRPGWPTQQEWVSWTSSFDWLAVAVGFIRAMLDVME